MAITETALEEVVHPAVIEDLLLIYPHLRVQRRLKGRTRKENVVEWKANLEHRREAANPLLPTAKCLLMPTESHLHQECPDIPLVSTYVLVGLEQSCH